MLPAWVRWSMREPDHQQYLFLPNATSAANPSLAGGSAPSSMFPQDTTKEHMLGTPGCMDVPSARKHSPPLRCSDPYACAHCSKPALMCPAPEKTQESIVFPEVLRSVPLEATIFSFHRAVLHCAGQDNSHFSQAEGLSGV